MRIRRDISSIPERSASETWDRIVDLVTGLGSKDIQQLKAAGGVMGSIITDEPSGHPPDPARRGWAAIADLFPVRHGRHRDWYQGRLLELESDRRQLDDARALRS